MTAPRVVTGYKRLDRVITRARARNRTRQLAIVSGRRVVDAVAVYTGVSEAAMVSANRTREATYARHLAMYALAEHALLGPRAVGGLLGNRDHSTVRAGIRRIARELGWRRETVADLDAIAEGLRR